MNLEYVYESLIWGPRNSGHVTGGLRHRIRDWNFELSSLPLVPALATSDSGPRTSDFSCVLKLTNDLAHSHHYFPGD